MERTEMRMLRRVIEVTSRERKRNDEIKKELQVCIITAKARENRLRWFGHMHRAGYGKPAKDIKSTVDRDKRGRRRLRTRWMDNIERHARTEPDHGKCRGKRTIETEDSGNQP